MTFAAWQQEATTSSEMSLRSGTRDAVITNDASKEQSPKADQNTSPVQLHYPTSCIIQVRSYMYVCTCTCTWSEQICGGIRNFVEYSHKLLFVHVYKYKVYIGVDGSHLHQDTEPAERGHCCNFTYARRISCIFVL